MYPIITGYNIIEPIGHGGMASVYLAEQESLGRKVALKVMDTKTGQIKQSFADRFVRETKIVSQLEHPNIVSVYDAGIVNGVCFLSMEYVNGHDLKKIAHRLSVSRKLKIIRDIAKALRYSGEKGFVHRDIKPENVLIDRETHRAVLMDFGIAKAAESDLELTQTGIALGTPYYMSPEQTKGKSVDVRSDIYSLGVMMFYLLEGRVPFEGATAVDIGIKHISEPIPALSSPFARLMPLLNRMLAKNPADRFPDGAALVRALEKIDFRAIEKIASFNPDYIDAVPSSVGSDKTPAPWETKEVILAANEYKSADRDQHQEIAFEYDDFPEGSGAAYPLLVLLVVLISAAGLAVFYWLDPVSSSRLTASVLKFIEQVRSWIGI